MKKTLRTFMKLQMIVAVVLSIVIGCGPDPTTTTTAVPFAQAMRMTNNNPWYIVDQNKDTLFFTSKDTTISITYQIPDTAWRRYKVPTTPPVDPPSNPGSSGLTGYGTVIEFNPFNSLSQDQLGKGKLVADNGDTLFNAIVNKGDPQISSGWRSEQNWKSAVPTEGGCEFDVRFLTIYSNSLFWQIHGNTSGTSGPVAMWTSGGFQCVRSVDPVNRVNIYQKGPLESIQTNKWYHFRMEWRFAGDNTGYFRVIKDGKLYYGEAENTKTNDPKGQYGKIGLNLFAGGSGGAPGSSSVQYNNFYVFRK